MKAEEARKLSHDHSKRMQALYKTIESSALRGYNQVCINCLEASKSELEVLTGNGFSWKYETSETDGGQFIIISW